MAKAIKKLPVDTNKRAKAIVDALTADKEPMTDKDLISAVMSEMGRKGGLKGGNARAKKLTSERRSEIAKKAAAARWGIKSDDR